MKFSLSSLLRITGTCAKLVQWYLDMIKLSASIERLGNLFGTSCFVLALAPVKGPDATPSRLFVIAPEPFGEAR